MKEITVDPTVEMLGVPFTHFASESDQPPRPHHDQQHGAEEDAAATAEPCKRNGDETEHYPAIASTPPMISESSVVIWLWRARLYCIVSDLAILSALSVALFMATIRATCSDVVASMNAWNIAVFTVNGSSSSSSSRGSGEKSYIVCTFCTCGCGLTSAPVRCMSNAPALACASFSAICCAMCSVACSTP